MNWTITRRRMIPGIRVKISKPQKIPQTMGKHESKGFERKKKKTVPRDQIESNCCEFTVRRIRCSKTIKLAGGFRANKDSRFSQAFYVRGMTRGVCARAWALLGSRVEFKGFEVKTGPWFQAQTGSTGSWLDEALDLRPLTRGRGRDEVAGSYIVGSLAVDQLFPLILARLLLPFFLTLTSTSLLLFLCMLIDPREPVYAERPRQFRESVRLIRSKYTQMMKPWYEELFPQETSLPLPLVLT